MTKVGFPCAPANSTKLEKLGERSFIILNAMGGMGGSSYKFVAKILDKSKQIDNFIKIKLTESNRTLRINPDWISLIEDVTLYKRTHTHFNNNYKSPTMIDYMFAKGGEEIVLVKEFMPDDLKSSKLCFYIEEDKC